MGVAQPTEPSATMKPFPGADRLNSKKMLPRWRLKKTRRAGVGWLNKNCFVLPDFLPTPIIIAQLLYFFCAAVRRAFLKYLFPRR